MCNSFFTHTCSTEDYNQGPVVGQQKMSALLKVSWWVTGFTLYALKDFCHGSVKRKLQ
jgi:hypothetical protein